MKFLAKDVEKITGVRRNRLEQWLSRGFISPSIQEAEGPGTRNVWSRNDLYTIAIFKKVTESGLSREIVSDLLSKGVLRDESDKDISAIAYFVYILGERGSGSLAMMIFQVAVS